MFDDSSQSEISLLNTDQSPRSPTHHTAPAAGRGLMEIEIHANDHPFARHNEKEIVRMHVKINKIKIKEML